MTHLRRRRGGPLWPPADSPPENVSPSPRRGGACPSRHVSGMAVDRRRGGSQTRPSRMVCNLFVGAAPCGRPQAFPLPGGRWHGEAVTDEGDRQILPFPISLPPGEGAPVRTLGRMRGTVPVMRAVCSTVGATHWAARFPWIGGRPKGLPYPTPKPFIKGRYRAQRNRGDGDLPLPQSLPPFRGKVPSEARRMRVGSGMAELPRRAGQCPAPTKKKETLPDSP